MIKKITERLKYWGQLLLLPVYWLSFLVPGNKRMRIYKRKKQKRKMVF
ncbi:hypothetical protein NE645_02290 [Roseburia hominis]|nr:hypothetical protein [Roseburia hominis]